jgi:iron(III) transport system ATP-binding protein
MLHAAGLVKSYRGRGARTTPAVRGVSLEVPPGCLYTILGPSGCGKTTLLRCVAGLERPDAGEIAVGGRVLFSAERGVDLPADERGIGMVFQSYAIWPHMSVFDNAAFPLAVVPRRRRLGRREIRDRVERVLRIVRLDGLADRPATDLSGGQQQRLALARALVPEPRLLLLDEPLSNLDARLREELRFELERVQRELAVTTLYVTHDQEEALAISDVVAVMRDGRIEQTGTPAGVYERPTSAFVADFLGAANLIGGRVAESTGNGVCTVTTPQGTLRVRASESPAAGAEVVLVVRPERIVVAREDVERNGDNRLVGVVQASAFLGGAVDHLVEVDGLRVRARTDPARAVAPGTRVVLTFAPEAGSVLPAPASADA